MTAYLKLPWIFTKFWFYEAPIHIFVFFTSVNHSFFQFLSLPLLLRTFFKPIKNEYRSGLVGFSIGMGMAVKSVLIVVNLVLFIPLLVTELFFFFVFITFPLLTIGVLFI